MRISAIEHVLPAKRVTNEDLIEHVARRNQGHLSAQDLDAVAHAMRRTLRAAGTEVRYHLGDGERPIDLAAQASRDAMRRAAVDPSDIDFVIYASVGRGWTEPATAPLLQAALALPNATAFDVLDACAGWLRALHIAHSFLRTGTYRRGLIVNCECGFSREEINWTFANLDGLDTRIAACTIGEAATATIVDADPPDDDFHFAFRTAGEHAGLCVIPLSGVAGFGAAPGGEPYVPGRFFSMSHDLVEAVHACIVDLFQSDARLHGEYDIAFGHEVSERVCEAVTRRLGVDHVYFPTHRRYGNTVSASVPLSMSTALREGRLARGQRVLVVMGAAGVSVGFASFTY